jgi:uncharacterized cupin superfamily protein
MANVIIKKMTPDEIREKGIESWPVWTKETSRFNWEYTGKEECYIIEGEFTVETEEGNFEIKPGDFVTFNDGLKCVWDIKKPVRKYYNFP